MIPLTEKDSGVQFSSFISYFKHSMKKNCATSIVVVCNYC